MFNPLLFIVMATGFCSLGYQVVWQRYLAVLVGSQARSSTIIVAIFLLGLALGYALFGVISKRIKSRNFLLKIYGFVELATGSYAVLFPSLFHALFVSSFSETNHFFVHILLTGLLLSPATILMGATIPVMTTVLPERDEDVNFIHSRIYALNTLGAFLGTLLVAFFLLPKFGYELSLVFLGLGNVLASLFYIKNNLSGETFQKNRVEHIESSYSPKILYCLGFIAGLTVLSLEVLWFRILSLSIGSSFLIFPFILSIFILMIGLGPLTLKNLTLRGLKKTLFFSMIFTLFSFVCVPYLPLIISNIRVLFISHTVTFYIFHILIYGLILLLLGPAVFYLGRLLPYAYALLKKNKEDYGLKCGYLYFFNTLGTFIGAVFLGYLAFYVFQLDKIYMIVFLLFFAVAVFFLYREGFFFKVLVILTVSALFLPFSRYYLSYGTFRQRTPKIHHFKNIFSQTNRKIEGNLFLRDGPNTTVFVKEKKREKGVSKSVFVNGKSDGDTVGDYPTVSLLALLPYLGTSHLDVKTSVIGIGTGLTAGVLTKLERVSKVDVVEISTAIKDSIPHLAPENNEFHKSPKTTLNIIDAFQFFKITPEYYDIIISEPSNPWVVGVEDLFTEYFYQSAKSRLRERGLFVQWMHTYSMSKEALLSVIRNLKKVFPNVTAYDLGYNDIILIASDRPEQWKIRPQKLGPYGHKVLNRLDIPRVEDLNFFESLNSLMVDGLLSMNSSFYHGIFHPQLSRRVYRNFFTGTHSGHLHKIAHPSLKRMYREGRFHLFSRLSSLLKEEHCQKEFFYPSLRCIALKSRYKMAMDTIQSNLIEKRLKAYSFLRNEGLIQKDLGFIRQIFKDMHRKKKEPQTHALLKKIIQELIIEEEFVFADVFVERAFKFKFIDEKLRKSLLLMIKEGLKNNKKLKGLKIMQTVRTNLPLSLGKK